MSTIAVRKDDQSKSTPTTRSWEPFSFRTDPLRTMRELLGWDPFREMAPLATVASATFAPTFEVKETKDGYCFKADVPGVKESDIEVTLTGNRLTMAGRRDAEKQEQTDTIYTYERSYGEFTRSFTLPEGIDASTTLAELKDGVLTVSVKKLPEAQPKKIAVQSVAKKS
jgi:HSP20 family protein